MSLSRARITGALLAFCLLAAHLLGLSIGAAPARAAEPESGSEQFHQAFEQITQCVAVNGTLLVSLLVDHTGTLQTMDPQLDRQGAVIEIIDALAELAGQHTADGQPISVEASMALFGDHYREISGWGDVADAHGDQLRQAALAQINNENLDNQTNFGSALAGAQASINARAAELPGQACSIIFWFTDGRLDVGPSDLAATESVRNDICHPNGVADSIRQAGTHLIAMALFTEVADDPSVPESHRVSQADRDWLQAVAEGTGPGQAACGTPSETAGGYIMATDGPQLARQFAGVGAMIQGFNPGDLNLSNQTGPISFPVDAGVGRVRLAFSVDGPGSVPVVLPDGASVDLTASGQVGGLDVDSRGTGGAHVVTLSQAAGLPAGVWTIPAAGDGAAALVTDIYYFWDVDLSIAAPDGIVSGQANPVIVRRERHGAADQPDQYRASPISVTVNGEELPAWAITDHGDGSFGFDVDLTDGAALTSTQIVASARATTAAHGIELGPVTASQFFPVSPPAGFPSVGEAARLDFGTFSQAESPTRTLTLVGSDQGPTAICVGQPDFATSPYGTQLSIAVADDSADGCVELAANETRNISVAMSASEPGEGRIAGTLPLTLHSVRGDEPQTMSLPLAASMYRPIDAALRNWIIAASIATALALAWLVAALGRHRSDRFSTGPDFRVASVPVLVTDNGIERLDRRASGLGGQFFEYSDFATRPRVEPSPRAATSGLQFRRRGPVLWPWKSYQASVVAPEGAVAAIPVGNPVVVSDNGQGTATDFAFPTRMYLVGSPGLDRDNGTSATMLAFAEGVGGSINDRIADFNSTVSGVSDWREVKAALNNGASNSDTRDNAANIDFDWRQDSAAPADSISVDPANPVEPAPPTPIPPQASAPTPPPADDLPSYF